MSTPTSTWQLFFLPWASPDIALNGRELRAKIAVGEVPDILLMDKILHHLGWLKPYKKWDNHHPWCAGFRPSTVPSLWISFGSQRRWIFRANYVVYPRVETNNQVAGWKNPPIFFWIGDTATTQKWWISQPAMLVYRSVSPKPECFGHDCGIPLLFTTILGWPTGRLGGCNLHLWMPVVCECSFFSPFLSPPKKKGGNMLFFVENTEPRRRTVGWKIDHMRDFHQAGVKCCLFRSWTSIQYPVILLIVSNEKGCS